MNVFVIHRFSDIKELQSCILKISVYFASDIKFIILDSSKGSSWKKKALKSIHQSELILVYNREHCLESENAKWEIQEAYSKNIPVIEIEPNIDSNELSLIIKRYYDYNDEFMECFSEKSPDRLELYKMMVSSSESLIERRQKTNAFFISIMGSLIAVGGVLNKLGVLTVENAVLVAVYCVVALLLCNSWSNLIDNYGKLNTAKFKVIGHLEKHLGDQIFNAEWIALGKGKRNKKYRSFTNTEKNVPLYMAVLFLMLCLVTIFLKISG